MSEIEGRVALITGASRGLGAAIAKALGRGAARSSRSRRAAATTSGSRARSPPVRRPRPGADRGAGRGRGRAASAASTSSSPTPASAATATSSTSTRSSPTRSSTSTSTACCTPSAPTLPALLDSDARRPRGRRLDRRPARPGGRGDLRGRQARAGRVHARRSTTSSGAGRSLLDPLPRRDRDRLRDGPRPDARRPRPGDLHERARRSPRRPSTRSSARAPSGSWRCTLLPMAEDSMG